MPYNKASKDASTPAVSFKSFCHPRGKGLKQNKVKGGAIGPSSQAFPPWQCLWALRHAAWMQLGRAFFWGLSMEQTQGSRSRVQPRPQPPQPYPTTGPWYLGVLHPSICGSGGHFRRWKRCLWRFVVSDTIRHRVDPQL